tara:strand:+ start:1100 stop:2377 length:1278 start_codon:yes stop_codon:yes gene_type:complete
MRQITSGEILKNKKQLFFKKDINNFLHSESEYIKNISNKNIIYHNKMIVNHSSFNFLNATKNSNFEKQFKKLFEIEFNNCEKIFPFLGDLFFDLYFDLKDFEIKKNKILINKKNYSSIIKNLKFDANKKIFSYIFKNCSLEYTINVKSYKGNEIIVEKQNNNNFNVSFDNSYLGSKNNHIIKNYRFLLYDGYIQNIGEIHHILNDSYEKKEPYVIFCFGVSQEVKKTIIENNKKGLTEFFPISLERNEENLNILNDIAILHNSDIISIHNGDTISKSFIRGIPVGKSINIKKNSFVFQRICNDFKLQSHKSFLEKRIANSNNLNNSEFLIKRLKRVNEKLINIFLPEISLTGSNSQMIREFEYCISLIKKINLPVVKFKNKNDRKFYFIPFCYINLLLDKVDSFKKILNNINCALIDIEKEKKCQ